MPGPEGPHAPHALILASRARALRRELGAVAWSVLEDVATDAVDGVAFTNARLVAADLGIGKDAAARALARLVEARLLVRVEQSRGGGRFSSGSYELRLPPGLLVPCPVAADTESDQADRFALGSSQDGRLRGRQEPRGDSSPRSAAASPDRPARRGRRAPAADPGQLSLLDVVGDELARRSINERQRRRKPEAQDPEAQDPEAQDPEAQDPENRTPEDFTPLHRGCGDCPGEVPDDVSRRSSPGGTRPC